MYSRYSSPKRSISFSSSFGRRTSSIASASRLARPMNQFAATRLRETKNEVPTEYRGCLTQR